jgi:hypothetical protein
MTDATQPLCMSCRRIPGARRVLSSNKKTMMWKCHSCINHRSTSFLHPEAKKGKLWSHER